MARRPKKFFSRPTFFSVLRSNIKCAFCKEKDCRVRYYPERKFYTWAGGHRFVTLCKKDEDEHVKEILKRKLP